MTPFPIMLFLEGWVIRQQVGCWDDLTPNNPEVDHTLQVKDTVFRDMLSPQTPAATWGSIGSPCFWSHGYKLGVTQYPLRFSNSREQLTGPRRALYVLLKCYYSKGIQIRAIQRNRCPAPGLGGSQVCEVCCYPPKGSGCITHPEKSMCDNVQSITNQRSYPKLQCPEFLLVFHYIDAIDWIITRMAQSPAPFPALKVGLTACGSKPQLSNHMVGLTGVASPRPESSPYRKLSGPPWITETLLSLGNSKDLEANSQELGTKANQILYSKSLEVASQQAGQKPTRFFTRQLWKTKLLSSVVYRSTVHS